MGVYQFVFFEFNFEFAFATLVKSYRYHPYLQNHKLLLDKIADKADNYIHSFF